MTRGPDFRCSLCHRVGHTKRDHLVPEIPRDWTCSRCPAVPAMTQREAEDHMVREHDAHRPLAAELLMRAANGTLARC